MSMNYNVLDCDDHDEEDESLYEYIAIIKNETAYRDYVENSEHTEKDYHKVTKIHFGEKFNTPISDLPSQITYIKICKHYPYMDTIPSTVKQVFVKKGVSPL
jgi:hypothetical protein